MLEGGGEGALTNLGLTGRQEGGGREGGRKKEGCYYEQVELHRPRRRQEGAAPRPSTVQSSVRWRLI